MTLWRYWVLIRDADVTGAPTCKNCGESMKFTPNENRTGISFVDRHFWNGDLRGWWSCAGCSVCRGCERTLRADERYDCWICPCCDHVPGAVIGVGIYPTKKGEACKACGCLEGQCICTFACVYCGIRHKTPECPQIAMSAKIVGISYAEAFARCEEERITVGLRVAAP